MKKFIVLSAIAAILMGMLTGCGGTAQNVHSGNAQTEKSDNTDDFGSTIRLGGLKGPTSMGMVKLLDDAQKGDTVNTYEFTMAGSADELTPKLLKGELDIIAAPVNLGSVLYNKSEGRVQLLAVNTLGVLYIVEKGGDEINSLSDLKGKKIYATGKGSTPEYSLNYLLDEANLAIGEDVEVIWKSEPSEVVSQMALEDKSIAMLPEPYVCVAQNQLEDLRISVSLNDEWEALNNGSAFVTAGLIIRKEFAEENPVAVSNFLEEYEASTKYVNENAEEAASLVEKYDIVKADVAKQAIPYCNIVCITGEEMKEIAEGYLKVLYNQNAQSVGGKLPGDDFYKSE